MAVAVAVRETTWGFADAVSTEQKWEELQTRNEYTNDYYFISQLYNPLWRPGNFEMGKRAGKEDAT
jgi:hypothetical protein